MSSIKRNIVVLFSVALAVSLAWAPAQPAGDTWRFAHTGATAIQPRITLSEDVGAIVDISVFESVYRQVLMQNAPPPEFAIQTGSLTAFGLPGETRRWAQVLLSAAERRQPGFKIYLAPGEDDFAWVCDPALWIERHQGLNYSYQHRGVHFVVLCAVVPGRGVPALDGKALEFLRSDLSRVPPESPIIVALSVPLDDERWPVHNRALIMELLRRHDVVLALAGPHANKTHEIINGIDVVYAPGVPEADVFTEPPISCNIVTIEGSPPGTILVQRIEEDGTKRDILKKDIVPMRELSPEFNIISPVESVVADDRPIAVQAALPADSSANRIIVSLNGEDIWSFAVRDGLASGTMTLEDVDIPGEHRMQIRAVEKSGAVIAADHRIIEIHRSSGVAGPCPEWRFEMSSAGLAPPSIHEGLVYIGDLNGTLYALDAETGRPRWAFDAEAPIYTTPAISSGYVIVATGRGKIFAIAADGRMRWIFDAGFPIFSAPAAGPDGVVYLGSNAGDILALDAGSGDLLWRSIEPGYAVTAAPLISGERLYAPARDGFLYAFDRLNGSLFWKRPGPSQVRRPSRRTSPGDHPPAFAGGHVFIADRGLRAGRYATNGTYRGEVNRGVSAIGSSADGRAVLLARAFGPVSKEAVLGRPLWEGLIVTGREAPPPVESGGVTYVLTEHGMLAAYDAQIGRERWRWNVSAGSWTFARPVIAGDRLYVVNYDGIVTALKIK